MTFHLSKLKHNERTLLNEHKMNCCSSEMNEMNCRLSFSTPNSFFLLQSAVENNILTLTIMNVFKTS